MLERVFIVRHVVVVVVGISEEAVATSKGIRRAEVGRRQESLVRFLYGKHVLGIVSKVLAKLVSKVGVSIPVSDYLQRLRSSYGAMISCQHYGVVGVGQHLEQVRDDRVPKP